MTDHDEERRRNHRRTSDHPHLQWRARAIGVVVAITAVVSVVVCVEIATLTTIHSIDLLNARIDAIQMDVSNLNDRVMWSTLTPLKP
jgi:anti-sigma-K factor RskA